MGERFFFLCKIMYTEKMKMFTNIAVRTELHKKLKIKASKKGISLHKYIEELSTLA